MSCKHNLFGSIFPKTKYTVKKHLACFLHRHSFLFWLIFSDALINFVVVLLHYPPIVVKTCLFPLFYTYVSHGLLHESPSMDLLSLAHGDGPALYLLLLGHQLYVICGVATHRQEADQRGSTVRFFPGTLQIQYDTLSIRFTQRVD